LTKTLLLQDGFTKKEVKAIIKQSRKELFGKHTDMSKLLKAYLKPSFHPNGIDERHLVKDAMTRLGIA
jgi:predicted metal-dependent hydrolase